MLLLCKSHIRLVLTSRKGELIMIRLKRTLISVCIFIALTITYLMLLVCIMYISIKGIKFSIGGTSIWFNDLTYSDLKQLDIQPNTVFIVTDGDKYEDITTCTYPDDTPIKYITAVVTNTNNVCDFSVYGVKLGSSADAVNNMPKETVQHIDANTDTLMSMYTDKDNNVLIVGTDTELGIVSYITIRKRN